MREIKFRAWDGERMHPVEQWQNKSWVAVPIPTNDGNGGVDWHLEQRKIDDIQLMQYTGLQDKTGRDIFDGDIVECVFATGKEFCKVIEEKGCFWVSQKGMKYLQTEAHDNLYWHNSECEIIGNIYENPELLNIK